jgi:hypothetical protein
MQGWPRVRERDRLIRTLAAANVVSAKILGWKETFTSPDPVPLFDLSHVQRREAGEASHSEHRLCDSRFANPAIGEAVHNVGHVAKN